MLSRLKVRTKLLAIVLPLLVATGALAGFGVRDRVVERDGAAKAVTLVQSASAGETLVGSLQLERLASVAPAGDGTAWAQAVKRTDRLAADLWERLGGVGSMTTPIGGRSPSQVVNAYRRQIQSIDAMRPSGPVEPAAAHGPHTEYSAIIAALSALNVDLVRSAPGLGGSADAAQWIAASNEADARAASAAMVLSRAGAATVDPALAWAVPEVLEGRRLADTYIDVFTRTAPPADAAAQRTATTTSPYDTTTNAFVALGSLEQGQVFATDPSTWQGLAETRINALRGLEQNLFAKDGTAAEGAVNSAEREMRLYLGGATAAIILALLVALAVARSIVTPLRRLSRAASDIAGEQLPRLVESMRAPSGAVDVRLEPIDITSGDELGDLAAAFNEMQRTAAEVASEQAATLRKGISELFVNLARRNQTLLDRQIEFIDRLEANEEDPDQLENLFKLDHLATRMRRNAESLLVLAGSEGPRRRSKEVAITDVIRVAVGEVEDFARISLLAMDEVMTVGSAAVDVAHLLSELMENGTQYSPPDRRVEVVGHRMNDGGYVVSVSDQGVGMSEEQLLSANQLLASPPVVGLSLSRSLGFVVAATLAARHDIDVRLAPSPSGGVAAMVTLPPALVVPMPTVEVPVEPTAPSVPLDVGDHFDPSTLQIGQFSEAGPADAVHDSTAVDPVDGVDTVPVVGAFADLLDHPQGSARLAESPFDYADDPVAAAEELDCQPDPAPPVESPSEPVHFAAEAVPDVAEVTSLDARIPMGAAFEQGLFSLLDSPEGEQPTPGVPTGGTTPLPTRTPISNDGPTDPVANSDPPPLVRRVPKWSATDAVAASDEERSGQADPWAPAEAAHPARPSAVSSLPKRIPGGTPQVAVESTARIAAPGRAPEEIRSILSRYRSGLHTGRDESAATSPSDQPTQEG